MTAAVTILKPQTAAQAAFPVGGLNTNEADSLILIASGTALGATEFFNIFVLDSAGNAQPLNNTPLGVAPMQLGNGVQTIFLPGGALYSFTKTASASAAGLDYMIKPRIGFSGS